jgi:type I protein arginine methyltransferase
MDVDSAARLLTYHRGMIADRGRTGSLHRAIHETVKPGDVVVDMGTGTGVLACFACQAGAACVHAIEAGDVVDFARLVVQANGFADRVHFHEGLSYGVELPELGDVLITETLWNMGLGEGMLGFVLDARRRFVKPGAPIVPGTVEVALAPIRAGWFDALIRDWPTDHYDLDFSPILPFATNAIYQANFAAEDLAAAGQSLTATDLRTTEDDDVTGEAVFVLTEDVVVGGLGGWFSSQLSPSVRLSNEPPTQAPSWAHGYLPFERAIEATAGTELHVRLDTAVNGTVWRWRTEVRPPSGASVRFDQSTFFGQPRPTPPRYPTR